VYGTEYSSFVRWIIAICIASFHVAGKTGPRHFEPNGWDGASGAPFVPGVCCPWLIWKQYLRALEWIMSWIISSLFRDAK
jgi:hypothetical protein